MIGVHEILRFRSENRWLVAKHQRSVFSELQGATVEKAKHPSPPKLTPPHHQNDRAS
jgi:hypothetical protein